MRNLGLLAISLIATSCGESKSTGSAKWSPDIDLPVTEAGWTVHPGDFQWIEIGESGQVRISGQVCDSIESALQALALPDAGDSGHQLVPVDRFGFAADKNARCESLIEILDQLRKLAIQGDFAAIPFTILTSVAGEPEKLGSFRFKLAMPPKVVVDFEPMVVTRLADGTILVGDDIFSSIDLLVKLREYSQASSLAGSKPSLLLVFDRRVLISEFVEVLSLCHQAGITNLLNIRLN